MNGHSCASKTSKRWQATSTWMRRRCWWNLSHLWIALACTSPHGRLPTPWFDASQRCLRSRCWPKSAKRSANCRKGRGGRTVRFGRDEYYHTPAHCSDQLRERQPLFALIREWCGREVTEQFDEIAGLRAEVMRLRGLLERVATQLKDSGHPHWARQLRKELEQ